MTKNEQISNKNVQSEQTVKYVLYRRVSTAMQNESGLGLAGQQTQINNFLNSLNYPYEIIGDFEEQESGKKSNRPLLLKAIELVKKFKAVLLAGTLDRISRDLNFISNLMSAGIDFKIASSPNDSRLVTQIKASIAEDELRKISDRTSRALQELKKKGVRLGTPDLKIGAKNRERAKEFDMKMKEIIIELNITDVDYLCYMLNKKSITNYHGNQWHFNSLKRLLKRIGLSASKSKFDEKKELIKELKIQGYSVREIARQLNLKNHAGLYKYMNREQLM